MRTFQCDACGAVLYFENSLCVSCGAALAFFPETRSLAAVVDEREGLLRRTGADTATHRHCKNRLDHAACNWAVPLGDDVPYCGACRLNQVIPDATQERFLELWRRLEVAKRRLLYTLSELGLDYDAPLVRPPLRFQFLSQGPGAAEAVLTGHAGGVITIDLAEADPSHREAVREAMREGYRTLLGHFRHESGHYFWERLIAAEPGRLAAFRELFGDERADYAAALERHYEQGDGRCPDGFVSAYATMHPWEDWAETWAHYLHMVDTLQTARVHGVSLGEVVSADGGRQDLSTTAVDLADFDELAIAWRALTVALNSLNRSMGLPDAYPFALTDGATKKLRFVHDVILGRGLSRGHDAPRGSAEPGRLQTDSSTPA